jgi:hypothetical protein
MSYVNNNWLNGAAIPGSGRLLHQPGQSINTISLSNIAGASGSSFGLSYDVDIGYNTNVTKYEVYEISQDLLALSVCWARMRKERREATVAQIFIPISKLLDSELFRQVTPGDISQANTIRDYYSKKIMMWKLKNIPLTSFRNDLNTFIHSDGKTFKENMMPLAYRLPEFYDYDIEFEKMSLEHNKEITKLSTPNKELKFVKKLFVNNRRLKRNEYWFSDANNNLVSINIEANNPLLSLLDVTLSKGDITLDGPYSKRNRDGTEYLRVDKIKFV